MTSTILNVANVLNIAKILPVSLNVPLEKFKKRLTKGLKFLPEVLPKYLPRSLQEQLFPTGILNMTPFKIAFSPSLNTCFLSPAKKSLSNNGDLRGLSIPYVLRVLTKGFIILGIFLGLTNCAMLGIHDQSFECPPEEGMTCTSVSRVNNAIDQTLDNDSLEESLEIAPCKNCSCFSELGAKKSSSNKNSIQEIPNEPAMRIWIAPRLVEGVMMESHYIVSKKGTKSSLKGDL